MYTIKKYTPEDFSVLQKWFQDWEWTVCSERTIAKNAFFICYQNIPIAFSYFAATDTNVAVLGFTISKIDCPKDILSPALDKLMLHLFEVAKGLNFEYIHYATDNKPMVKRLERLKLMQVTDNATGYLLTGSLTGKSIAFFDE